MRSQIKLGRIFGIQVGLHYSWFLIALLIVTSLWSQFHSTHPEWGDTVILALAILTGLLFFVSLLLHELAHSLFANSRGLPVSEITLFALGGVSNIEKGPTSAKVEFWMAFVGPLTSALIGALCLGARTLNGAGESTPTGAMLTWLAYINLALAVFNMLPGYPLDGGRILRAIIWWKTGDADRSTRLASKTGQIVGMLFIGYGVMQFFTGAGTGGLWTAFIGWFLLQAARETYLQLDFTRALTGVTAGSVMVRDCPVVDGNLNVQGFVDDELLKTGRRCFIVTQNGVVSGLMTPNEIAGLDRGRWPYTTLVDVMRPLEDLHTVTPDTPLQEALEIMGREDLNQLPVMRNGRLEGVLSRSQVLTFLQTRAGLQRSA